jgi:hypothetical protein
LYRSTLSGGFQETARIVADAAALALTEATLLIAEEADDKHNVRILATSPSGVSDDLRFRFPPIPPVTLSLDARGEAVFAVWDGSSEPAVRLHRRGGKGNAREPRREIIPSLRDVGPALSQGAQFLAVAAEGDGPSSRLIEVWNLIEERVAWKAAVPFVAGQPAVIAVSRNGDRLAVGQGENLYQASRSPAGSEPYPVHIPGKIKAIKFLNLADSGEVVVACATTRTSSAETRAEFWSPNSRGGTPLRLVHATAMRDGTPCIFGGERQSLAVARGTAVEVFDLAENAVVWEITHENEVQSLDAWGDPLRIISFSGQPKGFCQGSGCDFRGQVTTISMQNLLAAVSARGIRPYEPDRPAP